MFCSVCMACKQSLLTLGTCSRQDHQLSRDEQLWESFVRRELQPCPVRRPVGGEEEADCPPDGTPDQHQKDAARAEACLPAVVAKAGARSTSAPGSTPSGRSSASTRAPLLMCDTSGRAQEARKIWAWCADLPYAVCAGGLLCPVPSPCPGGPQD